MDIASRASNNRIYSEIPFAVHRDACTRVDVVPVLLKIVNS